MSLEDRHLDVVEEDVQLLQQHGLDHEDDERADGDAPDVAHAAEHDHREDRERHVNRNWSGLTIVSFEALNTPARPAVDAPSANASSFVVTVLMPFAAAASSSSRIAIHARPSRESCSR